MTLRPIRQLGRFQRLRARCVLGVVYFTIQIAEWTLGFGAALDFPGEDADPGKALVRVRLRSLADKIPAKGLRRVSALAGPALFIDGTVSFSRAMLHFEPSPSWKHWGAPGANFNYVDSQMVAELGGGQSVRFCVSDVSGQRIDFVGGPEIASEISLRLAVEADGPAAR